MLNISQAVELGSRFTVNFEKRTLRLDGKLVSLDNVNILPLNGSVMLREIEGYYQQYKHSIPSERSESHRRSYFKALPEKDLSDHDMLYGVSREVARCQLEVLSFLCCSTDSSDGRASGAAGSGSPPTTRISSSSANGSSQSRKKIKSVLHP